MSVWYQARMAYIEKRGMCKEEPGRWCTWSCSKFMRNECAGMRFIKTYGEGWTDQNQRPFPLYEEERKKAEEAEE